MACDVRIQPTAYRELENIVDYLSSLGASPAQSFLDEWERVLADLRSGVVNHRLSRFDVLARLGYHTVLMSSYIVLYFKEDNKVIIAHIFHQSRDYARIVLEGAE